MNINLPTIVTANSATAKLPKSSSSLLNRAAPENIAQLTPPQAQKPRIFKVVPDGIDAAQFAVNQSSSRGSLTAQQKPTEQYLANQNILQQEEITSLLGIDLFA